MACPFFREVKPMGKPTDRKFSRGDSYPVFITQKKLIISFFVITWIIVLLFNWVFMSLYSASIRQVVINESQSVVVKTNEFLKRTIEGMEYIADIVQNNPVIQRMLGMYGQDMPLYQKTYKEVMESLQGIVTNAIGSAESVDLYINRDEFFIASDYGLFSKLSWADKKYFELLQQTDTRYLLTDAYRKNLTFILNRNYEQITFIRPLYLLSEGKMAGVLAVNIDKYDLKTIIMGNDFSGGLILDDSGQVLVSSFPETNRFTGEETDSITNLIVGSNGIKTVTLSNVEYIVIYERSDYTGWRYASIVPANTSNLQMAGLRDTILILFIAMSTMTALLLVWLLSDQVYRRIRKLAAAMQEVEKGNLNALITHSEHDEFGFMYTSFNHMVGRIKSLFEELYGEKLLKKEAELKVLQSRINPHFIYNLFDNMNWLIQLGRYQELETLVDSVSGYYKKSVNAGRDFITVSDTVEQLRDYVKIQQIRFSNRFTCDFDIEKDLMDLSIPNFMLQPLVENAICHGIEPKTEPGRISIKGLQIDDRIFFTVEDDGVGISHERIQQIIKCLDDEIMETDDFFALANVAKRIKIYYGREYGLTLKSTQGVGTKVTVFIPSGPVKFLEVEHA